VDSEQSSDHCGDADCIVCRDKNSLVATYEDLPGWMFVLSEVDGGGCEVVAFDRERRRCMQAKGCDAHGMLNDLRARALELTRGCDDRLSATMPDAVASF
jgi:hypothetical protein